MSHHSLQHYRLQVCFVHWLFALTSAVFGTGGGRSRSRGGRDRRSRHKGVSNTCPHQTPECSSACLRGRGGGDRGGGGGGADRGASGGGDRG
eukprot:1008959-Amphidinium_carterae.1